MSISKNNDYTTDNLLEYEYLEYGIWKHYKLIVIDLSNKIQLENPDLRQQINFIGKLEDDKATMVFIVEKSEETTFWIFTKFCEYHIKWKHKNQKLVKWFKQWRLKICYKIVVCHRQSSNKKVYTGKAILLNLKQELLNQVFVIILMHLF